MPSYEITRWCGRLSVHPSVCPSLSFFNIGSLFFFDNIHDDSWPRYPVTDQTRFLKKKTGAWIWAKWARNYIFCHFLKLASLVLLDIVYNDSLQQCGTSSRSKFHLKNVGSQISTKGAKIEPKTSFFCHFLTFCSLVSFEISHNYSLQ